MDKNDWKFRLPEIILIALMSALNVGFDLVVSPPLKVALGHVVAGMLIMVPVNFLFITFTRMMVNRVGTISLYLTIFGALSIPTTMFGGTFGAYKILVGLVIGILLDIAYMPKNPIIKYITGTLVGAVLWWIGLFIVWQLFKLPFVTGFSTLLMGGNPNYAGFIDLSGILTLPITGFGGDFFLFAIICGLISAIPSAILGAGGYGLFKTVKKTTIYEKFQSMQ